MTAVATRGAHDDARCGKKRKRERSGTYLVFVKRPCGCWRVDRDATSQGQNGCAPIIRVSARTFRVLGES